MFFDDIFSEILREPNLTRIWTTKDSTELMLRVDSDYQIQNRKNPGEGRTIVMIVSSDIGEFAKPLILILNDTLMFPQEFSEIPKNFRSGNFKTGILRNEINLLIGAFSLASLIEAQKDKDVSEFSANGMKFEHVVAIDGTIQCFLKESEDTKYPWSLLRTDLDDKPLVGFKLKQSQPKVFPTTFTQKWYQKAAGMGLLEILNPVSQYPSEISENKMGSTTLLFAKIFQSKIIKDFTNNALVNGIEGKQVNISEYVLEVNHMDGRPYLSSELVYIEEDPIALTKSYTGRFPDNSNFRLLKPFGLRLRQFQNEYECAEVFTIASSSLNGFAITFLLFKDAERELEYQRQNLKYNVFKLVNAIVISAKLGNHHKIRPYLEKLLELDPQLNIALQNPYGNELVKIIKEL